MDDWQIFTMLNGERVLVNLSNGITLRKAARENYPTDECELHLPEARVLHVRCDFDAFALEISAREVPTA